MLRQYFHLQWYWALVVGICSSVHGQTATEVVSMAVRASFEDTMSSLSVQFKAKISDPPVSDEQLGLLVERERKALLFSMEMAKNHPELLKQYEDFLPNIEEAVRQKAEAYRIREVEGVYRRSGPFLGGDSIYEVMVEKGGEPPYGVFFLERRLDEQNLRSVQLDVSSKLVIVSSSGGSAGIPDPVYLGRLPVLFYSLYKSSPITVAFEEFNQEQNAGDIAVSYRFGEIGSPEAVFGRLVINTERGFICPYFEMNNSLGLVSRIVCDDFVQVGPGRDWYPTSATVIGNGPHGGVQETSISIRESSLRLNETLPQEIFSIAVPAGTSFFFDLGSGLRAQSQCAVTVDIDGLPALPDHKCLVVQDVPLGPGGNGRGLFIYGSALLLLAGVSLVIYKKMRKLE
jgi:hypothetical protein